MFRLKLETTRRYLAKVRRQTVSPGPPSPPPPPTRRMIHNGDNIEQEESDFKLGNGFFFDWFIANTLSGLHAFIKRQKIV